MRPIHHSACSVAVRSYGVPIFPGLYGFCLVLAFVSCIPFSDNPNSGKQPVSWEFSSNAQLPDTLFVGAQYSFYLDLNFERPDGITFSLSEDIGILQAEGGQLPQAFIMPELHDTAVHNLVVYAFHDGNALDSLEFHFTIVIASLWPPVADGLHMRYEYMYETECYSTQGGYIDSMRTDFTFRDVRAGPDSLFFTISRTDSGMRNFSDGSRQFITGNANCSFLSASGQLYVADSSWQPASKPVLNFPILFRDTVLAGIEPAGFMRDTTSYMGWMLYEHQKGLTEASFATSFSVCGKNRYTYKLISVTSD